MFCEPRTQASRRDCVLNQIIIRMINTELLFVGVGWSTDSLKTGFFFFTIK